MNFSFGNRASASTELPMQQFRRSYASGSVVLVLTVGLAIAILNWLGSRHHHYFDLTPDRHFSLSEQTIKVIEHLAVPVNVTAYLVINDKNILSSRDDPRKRLSEQLGQLAYYSKQIHFEIIDPNTDPQRAIAANIKKPQTVIFQQGDRSTRLENDGTEFTEQEFLQSLIKLSRDTKTPVRFVIGHGEAGSDRGDGRSLAEVKKALQEQSYDLSDDRLLSDHVLDDQRTILIIAGPVKDLLDPEWSRLDSYVRSGGKAILLLDVEQANATSQRLVAWGLKPVGVALDGKNAVPELLSDLTLRRNPAIPVVTQYESHDIVRDFKYDTIFPLARAWGEIDHPPSGTRRTVLFRTSDDSWAKSSIAVVNANPRKLTEDLAGPLALSYLVTFDTPPKPPIQENAPSSPPGEAIVVGDVDWICDQGVHQGPGNLDLFLNMVSYLAKDTDLISIRPKDNTFKEGVLLTDTDKMDQYHGLINAFALLFLPGSGIVTGIIVWWRRRGL